MNPENRALLRVSIQDAVEADDVFDDPHGRRGRARAGSSSKRTPSWPRTWTSEADATHGQENPRLEKNPDQDPNRRSSRGTKPEKEPGQAATTQLPSPGRGRPDRRQPRRGDEAVLPRLRHERHHRPGHPRHQGRPEARPPPRPLRHVRDGDDLQQALQEIGPHRRRRHRKIPSPRRPGRLRHARPHGPGLQPALSARRRPGQLRLDRRRPAGGHAVHRSPDVQAGLGDAGRHREGHGQLRPELRREPDHARGPAGQVPEPAGQRRLGHRRRHGDQHPAPQPGRGLRRAHLPHPAPQRRAWTRSWSSSPVPDFPTGGYIFNRQGIRDAYRDGQGRHPDPGQDHDRARRQGRAGADRHHRDPLRRQQVPAHREHRRARQREEARGHRRHPRRVRPGRASGSSSRSRRASCPRSS